MYMLSDDAKIGEVINRLNDFLKIINNFQHPNTAETLKTQTPYNDLNDKMKNLIQELQRKEMEEFTPMCKYAKCVSLLIKLIPTSYKCTKINNLENNLDDFRNYMKKKTIIAFGLYDYDKLKDLTLDIEYVIDLLKNKSHQ